MKNTLIPLALLTAAALFSHPAVAGKAYQWTDTDGVVHFSDAPPADVTAVTDAHEIDTGEYSSADSGKDRFSIIDQANIMQEWRRQSNADRLANKKLELEQQQLSQEMELNREQTKQRELEYLQPRPLFVYPYPASNHHQGHDDKQNEKPAQKTQPRTWGLSIPTDNHASDSNDVSIKW